MGLMLKSSLLFFIIGYISMLLAANGVLLTIETGKNILFVFLVLSVISFVSALVIGEK